MAIGQPMPTFELKDAHGTPFKTSALKNKSAAAVVFFGIECPIVKLAAGNLERYRQEFGEQVQWIGIDSNQQDSLAEINNFAKETGIKFPLLKDPGNKIADAFGAQRTPEVFLFDGDGKLCYHGVIDDQYDYGKRRDSADQHFLLDAIRATLAGKKPAVQQTDALGCIIGRNRKPDANAEVTYANQISRLLNERCVSCHREGEIGPFAMNDYEEVAGWAGMIEEVTLDRRMPPWHANPKHGDFENDTSLSPDELELIKKWVAAGAPFGDEQDLPPAPEFEIGWQMGKPDVVIPMSKRPYKVPATGVIPYQYYEVDPGFTEDKWVQAAECRIGNRAVVHHIIVGIKQGDSAATHGQIDSEWLTATAPGAPPLRLDDGYAKLIPKGAKLIFQMHYTPCGTEQEDLSSVGFKFADPAQVRKSVGTREVVNRRFRIPPHADNHEVNARYRFRQDALILSLFPHMHVRGKSFRYTAHYPNGQTEILLDIPEYDFNWQNGYKLREPKLMPAGTVLHCVAHFDNSANNFANPDPAKTVRWGDQTWDEMMIGYFDMVLADQDLLKDKSESPPAPVNR